MKKIFLLLVITFASIYAQNLKIGSDIQMLNNFEYETPKSRKMKIPLNTKTLLIAFDKDTGALVNEYLATKNKYFLQKKKAIFIADINKMPTVVTNMFALPKLRKYKHLIYLHYNEKFQNAVPKKDEKISVVRFEDKKVKSISYISTQEELKKVFD
ncbi:hypothetical protein [Sulfurimonas lithotrophica]|uniref:hypothetical protein n=1 Tax=Sulfurimonas lithotrophica TaxID=2590022 RepID=UPI00165F6AD4|nr:hypothetical protein [Sulfurimonas lithotrophica]